MEFHHKVAVRRSESKSGGKPSYRASLFQGTTRISGKGGFKSRDAADEWGLEQSVLLKHKAAHAPSQPRAVGKTFNDLATKYLARATDGDVAGGKGQSAQHQRDVGWWQERLGTRLIAEIDSESIREILATYSNSPKTRWDTGQCQNVEVPGQYPKAASRNRKLATARRVFLFAQRTRWVKDSPAHEVGLLREHNAIARGLNSEQQARLLSACRDSNWDRLYLYVAMLLTTGSRRQEVLELTWSQITLPEGEGTGTARVTRTKNGDPKTLILTPVIVAELRKFRAVGNALLFPGIKDPCKPYSIRKPWEAAVKRAGLEYPQGPSKPKLRIHDLRHTVGVSMATRGATLLEVGAVLGHRDSRSSARYAEFTDQQAADIASRWMLEVTV